MTPKQIKVWTWISRVLLLLMGLGGVLAAAELPELRGVQRWAALAVALLGAASAWVKSILPAVKSKVLPVVGILAIAGALMLSACPSSLAPGYRSLTVAVKVTNEGGKTLARVCKDKRLACVDKHGTEDRTALRKCLGDCPKALKHWVQIVKPAVGSGVGVTFQSLEAARDKRECAKNKPDCKNWTAKFVGWACTLSRAVVLWRDLLGPKAQTYLNLISSVEKWVCK
jgi:hypothetical protein